MRRKLYVASLIRGEQLHLWALGTFSRCAKGRVRNGGCVHPAASGRPHLNSSVPPQDVWRYTLCCTPLVSVRSRKPGPTRKDRWQREHDRPPFLRALGEGLGEQLRVSCDCGGRAASHAVAFAGCRSCVAALQ